MGGKDTWRDAGKSGRPDRTRLIEKKENETRRPSISGRAIRDKTDQTSCVSGPATAWGGTQSSSSSGKLATEKTSHGSCFEKKWWNKQIYPVRKALRSLSTRYRSRKSGLGKLQKDVKSCDYEDVHVLWEILNNESQGSSDSDEKKKKMK